MSQMPGIPAPLGPYRKPWKSCREQLELWRSRGIAVLDEPAAIAFLEHVNYYRLSAYCPPFEHLRDQFVIGTTFENIRAAYEFDWTLRDLVNEALEVVEVDVRTTVAHVFGHTHGAFGHVDSRTFHPSLSHGNWLHRLRKNAKDSDEQFVAHFAQTYSEFPDLPVWMLMEIISFGSLSMMFKHMLKADQRAIGTRYGVQAVYLVSWLHHLVYVRNICAHHARLWDRVWAIKPELPTSKVWARPELPGNDRLFVTLLMLNHLMKVAPSVETFRVAWKTRIETHLRTPPACPAVLSRMGLTNTWTTHPLWA